MQRILRWLTHTPDLPEPRAEENHARQAQATDQLNELRRRLVALELSVLAERHHSDHNRKDDVPDA